MSAGLENFWFWLYPILILPTAIYYGIKLRSYFKYKKPVQDNNCTSQTKTISLLKIKQREPSRHPPRILSIMTLIPAFILLAFGGWAIYIWIARIIEFQMNLETGFFFVLFIAFPLLIIIDMMPEQFSSEPKYYKPGRSRVAKEAIVTIGNDIDTVFDACYRVLDSMQAAISILEKPNLLKAKIKNSVMTITIIQIEDSKVRVYILSDSRWLTVKWDGGVNQRNIDSFLQELGKQ